MQLGQRTFALLVGLMTTTGGIVAAGTNNAAPAKQAGVSPFIFVGAKCSWPDGLLGLMGSRCLMVSNARVDTPRLPTEGKLRLGVQEAPRCQ